MHTDLFAHGALWAFLSAFGAGVLTSLTPCVYPLIPITVSLFGAGENVKRGHAALLGATYVGGICVMYSSLGVGSALAGRMFGTFMASPWVIVPIAVVFIAMAFSMFGAFEISLPSSLQTRLASVGGKSFGGAFAMGLVGGVIAAPCTGPFLASILAYVATTRSVVLGGSLLFTYALGMGMLFFLIAAFALHVPRAGAWMVTVKTICGVVLLNGGLYFLRNVVDRLAKYGKWELWWLGAHLALVAVGVIIGGIHLEFSKENLLASLRKGLGVAMVVLGIFGGIGWLLTPKPLDWLHGEAAVLAAQKSKPRPAFIDFYADWCLPCKELDVSTFADADVRAEFARFALAKVDCTTEDDPMVVATRQKYGAETLPTLVLLDSTGKVAKKIDHVVDAKELLPLLREVK